MSSVTDSEEESVLNQRKSKRNLLENKPRNYARIGTHKNTKFYELFAASSTGNSRNPVPAKTFTNHCCQDVLFSTVVTVRDSFCCPLSWQT